MNRIRAISLCVLIAICAPLTAQMVSFPANKITDVSQLTPFIYQKEVKGYSTVYPFQQTSGFNTFEYHLDIFDNNFQLLKESKFLVSPFREIKASRFNGSAVCILFLAGPGVLENQVYDLDGTMLDRYKVTGIVGSPFNRFHPIAYKGFIRYVPSSGKHSLELRSNSGEILWSIYPRNARLKNNESGPQEELTVEGIDSTLLILKSEVSGLKANELMANAKIHYRVYNNSTGEEICDLVAEENAKALVPSDIHFDKGFFTIYGQYFEPDDSQAGFDGRESLGFYVHNFNSEGKLLYEKYHPWNDVAVSLKTDIENFPDTSVWLNSIITDTEGNYFVIGELYTTRSARITDMIVLELDSTLQLKNSKRYAKMYKKIPATYQKELSNPYMLGEALSKTRMFDYRYGVRSADKAVSSIVYTNYPNDEKTSKKIFIGAIGFNRDRELVHTGFSLEGNPENVKLLPAKSGYVAVLEQYYSQTISILSFYKLDM